MYLHVTILISSFCSSPFRNSLQPKLSRFHIIYFPLITLKYDVFIQATKDRPWFLPLRLFVSDVFSSIPPAVNGVRVPSCGGHSIPVVYAGPQNFCEVYLDRHPTPVIDPFPVAPCFGEIYCPILPSSSGP